MHYMTHNVTNANVEKEKVLADLYLTAYIFCEADNLWISVSITTIIMKDLPISHSYTTGP